MADDREELITAYCAHTGKTREQAVAVLDLLASAWRRLGEMAGEPLTDEQRADRFNTFVGPAPASQESGNTR